MPYFIRGNCVWKGTKDNPIKEMKCHDTKKKARMHLAALYINVVDVQKQFSVYKEDDEDRWIGVSTAHLWDVQDEIFTKEAMDYDIAFANRLDEFPSLRVFHVRGFKVGMCDTMGRVDGWAFDQGYWYKTPFPQAMKELVIVDKVNKWRMSRGFFSVEATGLCPSCDVGLLVRLLDHRLGVVRCKECGVFTRTKALKRMQHKKAVTYDLTLTDIPAVIQTAVAAYTISK